MSQVDTKRTRRFLKVSWKSFYWFMGYFANTYTWCINAKALGKFLAQCVALRVLWYFQPTLRFCSSVKVLQQNVLPGRNMLTEMQRTCTLESTEWVLCGFMQWIAGHQAEMSSEWQWISLFKELFIMEWGRVQNYYLDSYTTSCQERLLRWCSTR